MADIFNLTDTWNNGATTFDAIKMNVTDTASAAASKLIDLQVGAVSQFKINKVGDAVIGSGIFGGSALGIVGSGGGANLGLHFGGYFGTISLVSGGTINFSSDASQAVAAADTALERQSAAVLKATNGAGGAGLIRLPALTVATLPAAATAGVGARSTVTDATAPTFGATVAGGGAVITPVYSDGTNWKVG